MHDDMYGQRACTIVNLSNAGARLCADGPVSGDFVLSIHTGAGERRRACRVVWRVESEIGVEFKD
jgi:hypothetical protein